jgi:hypothetical protein
VRGHHAGVLGCRPGQLRIAVQQTQSAGGAFLVGGCEQVLLGQGGCPLRLLRKGAGKDAGGCCNTQQQAF